jgi:hypothetical protein
MPKREKRLTRYQTLLDNFWFPNSVWESMKGRGANRDAEHRNRHSQPEVGNENPVQKLTLN